MKFKDYQHVSDLNPNVVHSIATSMQWIFFISFILFFINFLKHKIFIDLVVCVFFLRWSITTYQLMAIYDRCLFDEHNESKQKESDLQRLIWKMGRNARRKAGFKRID